MVALTILTAIVAVGSMVGFLARFHHKMNLEEWTVAGRGFGLVFVWLLMAGETFTAFTFLGASGWAYSRGAPVLYILAYATLIHVVAFYVLPPIWEVGRRYGLQTQADFFQVRYGSTYLSAFVALVGVVCIIPYLQIQLTGLGLIVEAASFGAIHRAPAMILGVTLVAGFVFVSGVRGIAWVSVLKDFLLLFTALFVAFAVPRIYFGGIGPMFAELVRTHPAHLVLPGSTRNLGEGWYVTTVLLISLTFFMWPQYFAASFTSRSSRTLRRNAVIMPLYSVAMPLVFFVGLGALLVLPNLSNGDLAMLTIVRKTFPAWFLGLVGGAGALTAMVPAAIQLLSGATLYAKNLFRPMLKPDMTDQQVARVARIMVLILTLGGLLAALYTSPSLVSLLLLGSAGIAQLFPGVVLGLFSKRVTTAGVFAGAIAGIALASVMILAGWDPFHGWNAGFLALCLNFVVTGVVSALTRVRVAGFEEAVPVAVATSGEK